MALPQNIRLCMQALEDAGFAAYCVGGCVRDFLLGIAPHDYDLCTAATPEQIRQVFREYPLVLAGQKHGTVGVVLDGEVVEITTFRTEGGYQDNRHPDWVRFVPCVEEDLRRRDFTVNAMAYSPIRGFADPMGGREDLQNQILRAVGDPETRFREDGLRILRGVRFAVRFGLTPDGKTEKAMLSLTPLLDNLAKERCFSELSKLLPLVKAEDLLRYAPILTRLIPELEACVGFDQRSPHHAYPVFTHIAHVTEAVEPRLELRLAALLHDIGKPAAFYLDENGRGHFPDHAKIGAQMANEVLLRLKAPTALRKQVVDLISRHMTPLPEDKKILRRRLTRYGVAETWDLLALQKADFSSKGTGKPEEDAHFDRVADLLRQIKAEGACLKITDLAINGRDLMALGYLPGRAIGSCLETLLQMVQNEELANSRDALLAAAKAML